jgi:hypothetical protein
MLFRFHFWELPSAMESMSSRTHSLMSLHLFLDHIFQHDTRAASDCARLLYYAVNSADDVLLRTQL